jgi:hypothetical protein
MMKTDIEYVSVPKELLQNLVDHIELNDRTYRTTETSDRKASKIAFARWGETRRQLEQATRDLLSYLRYSHNITAQGIPFDLPNVSHLSPGDD